MNLYNRSTTSFQASYSITEKVDDKIVQRLPHILIEPGKWKKVDDSILKIPIILKAVKKGTLTIVNVTETEHKKIKGRKIEIVKPVSKEELDKLVEAAEKDKKEAAIKKAIEEKEAAKKAEEAAKKQIEINKKAAEEAAKKK